MGWRFFLPRSIFKHMEGGEVRKLQQALSKKDEYSIELVEDCDYVTDISLHLMDKKPSNLNIWDELLVLRDAKEKKAAATRRLRARNKNNKRSKA